MAQELIESNNKPIRRGFIRTLWGTHLHQERRFYKRRSKIDDDIELLGHCKYNEPFTVYCFGQDNFDFIKSLSYYDPKMITVKLASDKNIVWDMETQQFRHKLECFKLASEDFDQFVFLDWDQLPVTKLPDNFWEILNKKEPLQAILRAYCRRKVYWRGVDQRKIPCASFLYIGDKQIPTKLIETWEKMGSPWSEECVISKYIDDINGGWIGMENWWKRYEIDFFKLLQSHPFSEELYATKTIAFDHFNEPAVNRELANIKAGKLKDWQIK